MPGCDTAGDCRHAARPYLMLRCSMKRPAPVTIALRTPSLNRALATARTSTKALVRTGETALASGEVINARMKLIADGMSNPGNLIDPELVGMSTENRPTRMPARTVGRPSFQVCSSFLGKIRPRPVSPL